MDGKRIEVMNHLEKDIGPLIPELTADPETCWQPADFLPVMGRPDSFEQVADLQEKSAQLSDDLLVVLVGDMITEEALPSYAMWIAQVDGFDRAGEPRNAWGDWLRRWVAEENRHGDILNRYLYLTGRVNMAEVEATIHNLLIDGGDVETATDPYRTFVYTSFQEIATRISHANVAARARKIGDDILGKLCGFIAADENRHAKAYKLFFQKVLDVDPDEALLAFQAMMKSNITMPAMYMRERGNKLGETFKKFADVAERNNVYTPFHYADILEHLVKTWDIGNLKGLSDRAEAAQQYLCKLPERYRRIAERFAGRISSADHRFSWLEMPEANPDSVMNPAV